jgi:RNA polymerase sigma factor (sigma-70 family)
MSPDEYSTLFRQLYAPACRYMGRQLHNEDHPDAEDLAADTFTRLFIITRTLTPDNPHAYTWRAIRNRIIDYKQTRHHRQPHLYIDHVFHRDDEDLNLDARPAPAPGGLPHPLTSPDIADLAIAHAGMTQIYAALAQLPGRQRTAVTLYYLHQYSPKEIGQQLHISAGAAKALIHRALVNLRAWLTP